MKEIAPETRWQIAAKSASLLPVLYSIVLRQELGETFDRRVEEVWCHCGGEVREIARAFEMPTAPADRLAASLLEILRTLFGTEFRGEIVDLDPERAVVLIKTCPFLLRALEMEEHLQVIFHPCMAFCFSAVETLNKDFSSRFVRAMCMGDKNCEIRIARKDSTNKKG
jgi:hypothetical protein